MKKNFKKVWGIIVTVLMMTLVLTACGNKKTTETAAPTTAPTQAPKKEEAPAATATPIPTPTEVPKNLNGLKVTVGDWWTTDPNAAPTNKREEDTLKYREEFQKKYNFTITRSSLGGWNEYQEIFVSSTMAGSPAADVFLMDQQFLAAPIKQGLLYPLNTLKNLDFTQDKWLKDVTELMTINGNVYGMQNGRKEPRLGIFFNKRLFEEANIDPNLPYDLQAKGEWTWAKFEELCKQLTRDTNNDSTPEVYALASFSVHFFRGCVFSNNAKFVGKDANGKYYNATKEANFLEALQWGRSIYDKGYVMPQPTDSNWDWFIAAFKEGKVAMQVSEEYMAGQNFKDMTDDFGFVIFPQGPNGEMMTVFAENVAVIPANMDKAKAENVAFAYNLYTNVTPGYEDEDWKAPYYLIFRDERAVDETLSLFYEPKHGTMSYVPLISGINYGDVCYDLDAGAKTPAELIEKVQSQWQQFLDEANGVAAPTK